MIKTLLIWAVALLAIFLITTYLVSWIKQTHVAKAYPPLGDFIEADGYRLHYLKSGSGKPLVLLHGAGGNMRDFTFEEYAELSNSWEVILLDRPGYGYSDAIGRGQLSLEDEAAILAKALEKLGIKKADFVGYSYGGGVTTRLALDHPELVDRMVLIAPTLHDWPDRSVNWTNHVLAIPAVGRLIMNVVYAFAPKSYFEELYAGVFTPQDPPEGYVEHVGLGLSTKPAIQVFNGHQIVNLLGELEKMIPRYGELSHRIHIIHGTSDKSVSYKYHAQDFVKDAVNAQITTDYVEGIGHGILQVERLRILKAIEDLSQE